MRVRKQDANGDYTIGQGEANFWVNSPLGVAQTIETRLLLWEGEWFLDNTQGTPWSQEILGYNTASLRDIAITSVILETTGVTSLATYQSTLDPETRELLVSGSVFTSYSTQSVPFGPVIL